MGGFTAAPARRALAGLCLVVAFGAGGFAGSSEPWMPETLPGLVRALELGIEQNLTPPERVVFSRRSYEEIRDAHPEMHAKIRQAFETWTDAWVRRAGQRLERVPEKKIRRARQAVAEVDRRLGAFFESRGWTYRKLEVVLLPEELMAEPGLPAIRTRGIYFLYYPDVLFVALDAHPTMRHTLIHEGLHFNKTGPGLGRTLAEGIAEAAATWLALEWGMVSRSALRAADYYPHELRVVEYIIDRMVVRGSMPREKALEILLHTYLTGDPAEMEAIFGSDAWSEVVRASRNLEKVRKTAKRALGS